jgi:hypothetical protein
MAKRKHDQIFYFKPFGLEVGIDSQLVSNITYSQPTHPWNPEEPMLWPATLYYTNGTYETFYFMSPDNRDASFRQFMS